MYQFPVQFLAYLPPLILILQLKIVSPTCPNLSAVPNLSKIMYLVFINKLSNCIFIQIIYHIELMNSGYI